jgi:L-threonylcarbamoyladenylate synthase
MEISTLTDENAASLIRRAVDVLERGGIVLYPTDTVYGLAVDALNRPALERLRELKGREKKKPISIIVPTIEAIGVHADLHPAARPLAERHLPGALTLVLPGKKHLPEELMLGGQVGIRIPNHAFGRSVADVLGRPITATSANRAGLPTPTHARDMIAHFGQFADRIDLIIDAGERPGRTPSTVVTFINGTPYVIREGALSRAELGLS